MGINSSDPAEKYQIMRAFCCEGPVAWTWQQGLGNPDGE